MATHELYVGGPGTTGAGRSMYPRPAFNADADGFKRVTPAVHKGPISHALTRTLDFANDHALMEYVRNNAIAAADVLNLQIIPRNCLLLGVYVQVENPVTGVSLTLTLDDGTTFGTAVDCGVAGSFYAAPNGAAWVEDGAASLATAEFANVVKMLQATVTAVPAGGFGALRVSVSPILLHLLEGQF